MVTDTQGKPDDKPKPRGGVEIRAALLAAADLLFGEKGPDAVSVRDIAAEAGLMPTLIHRYFGTKDELIRQVLQGHAATFRKAAGSSLDVSAVAGAMFDVITERPAFLRVIAYLVLAGHPPQDYLTKTGMVAKLAGALDATHGEQAKLEAAIIGSQIIGWLLFEPFLLYAADYRGDPAAARSEVFSRTIGSLPGGVT